MILFLDIVTTLCIGFLIGTEFAVSAFVNPVLWKLEERAQSRAVALFAGKLGTVMPFWYGASFLLLVGEMVTHRHGGGVFLLIAAGSIWAAVIILTLLFLVPINNRLARLDEDSPGASARQEHRRWDAMHRIRVAALIAAMICFLVAVYG